MENVAIPDTGKGLILKVIYCGICGSDRRQVLSAKEGERKIIGHEVVGEVVDGPSDLDNWIGKKVGIAPRIGCGKCGPCRRGFVNLCENVRTVGYQIPGGFAQFLAVPRDAVLRGNLQEIPQGLDEKLATLAEPLSCVVNGMNLSGIRPRSSVLILGAGPMGQMFLMMIRALTGDVFVVEPDPARREFALAHGASGVFTPDSNGMPEPDTIIIACSNPDAYRLALEIAPHGGKINLFGGLSEGVRIDSNEIHYKQLTLHGTSGSAPCHFTEALEALSRKPELGDLITDVLSFRELQDALLSRMGGDRLVLKTILDPWLAWKP